MRSERKILTVAEYAAKHLPDVTPAPITLYDVAVATMRRLFPNSRYVREIDRKMKVAALIAASRALRVWMLLPRSFSMLSRNCRIAFACISSKVRSDGFLPVVWLKC